MAQAQAHAQLAHDRLPTRRTAAITAGCPDAPTRPVAGLARRDRLQRTLARQGYELVTDPRRAERVVPDCHVLVGDEELHLCELGVPELERRLLESLRKPIDGIVARLLNRSISLSITRRLMNTRVTPNQVTVAAALIGLASGPVAALGGYWAAVVAALLLQLQSVFDGIDGELSRLRFQGSRLGQWLDTLADDLTNLSFLLGLTLAAASPALRLYGLLGCAAFVVTQAIVYYLLATVYHSGDLLAFPLFRSEPGTRIKLLFKRDFYCLAFLAATLVGRADVVLIAAGTGALLVLGTVLLHLARDGGGRAAAPAATATAPVPARRPLGARRLVKN